MTGYPRYFSVLALVAVFGVIGAASSAQVADLGAPAEPAEKPVAQQATTPADPSLEPTSVRAVLDRYCVTCHNEGTKAGGLALDMLDVSSVASQPDIWEKVVRKLRAALMPPSGARRPDEATHESLTTWLEAELDRAAAAAPNPGRTETFHRLNATEYRNAVRDVLGLDIDVSALLPIDDASYGFDNMAGVLKLDPSRIERYLSVADAISRLAVGIAPSVPVVERFEVSDGYAQYERRDDLPFGTRGGAVIRHHFPQDATYEFEIDLIGQVLEPDVLEMSIDGERVQLLPIEPKTSRRGRDPDPLRIRIPVEAGPRDVGFAFLKRPSVHPDTHRRYFERPQINRAAVMPIWRPFFQAVEINGPFDITGPGDTPSRRTIFTCRPSVSAEERPCAQSILATLARRAYRRPESAVDVENLLVFYDAARGDGSTFDEGIQLAIQRLLVSPGFLFRVEAVPLGVGPNTNYRISGLELASRLSFFLWSSIPDGQLLSVASLDQLSTSATMERQVRRMLDDERAHALITNFFGQWLQLRNLDLVRPSNPLFPDFDEGLRDAFLQETELLLDSIILENRSVVELLTANYTFLNERLANHYGIPFIKGSHFRRVPLPADSPRGGLLGHGSILTITSHGTRTSPVLRGKWILSNLLGSPPPDPPDSVPALPEQEVASPVAALSVRARMAEHRKNPVCASCHSMIDPLGFALENFDAIGRWRDIDETFSAVDASGVFPDGTEFSGFADFRSRLASRPEAFVTLFVEKLLTYALGRGLEPYDMPAVRRIVHAAAGQDYRFEAIVLGVVRSVPFVMRRSAPSPLADALPAAQVRTTEAPVGQ